MTNISLRWLSHLKEKEEKERLKRSILSVPDVWDRLRALCKEKKKINEVPDYDSPAWAYKQADFNGYNRAINEILELIPDNGEQND